MTDVAIVTGSSSGIGLATAEALLEQGYAVVLNARGEHRLEEVRKRLAGHGAVIAVAGDAAEAQTVEALVAAAQRLGQWRVAVANAGGGDTPTALAELTAEGFTAGLVANVVPTAVLLAAAARAMPDGGRFVAVSSVAGQRGSLLAGPDYSAAKAAVLGLVRHAARELAHRQITVNAVAPGVTDVERIQLRLEPVREQVVAGIPLGRLGSPAEIAATVCFLASPGAAYITGATLSVNGGLFMS